MKTKWIGLAILAVVIVAAAGYAVFSANAQVLELNGYLGGEKIGLLEDAEVQEIFRSRYHLSLDYARAGSLEMITADQTGMNYLFPSNQTALELYEQVQGTPYRSEIVLNTPIVLYTRAQVAEALVGAGIASAADGVYTVDMAALVACIEQGTSWAEIGLPELYGDVAVGTPTCGWTRRRTKARTLTRRH